MKRTAAPALMRSMAILQSAIPLVNIAVHADACMCTVLSTSIAKASSEIVPAPPWFSKMGRPMNAVHGVSAPTRKRARAACHAAGSR